MQVMTVIPLFGIGDFVILTEQLFEGFLKTAGYKHEKDGIDGKEYQYYLDTNRGLLDYVSRYKNNRSPRFMPNNMECYLNRCRYYIYKEKRENKYTDSKGNEVDSSEVFSQKSIRLFFQLSGLNFHFLRLQPIEEDAQESDITFRRMQERCLDDLFTVTVHYLFFHQEKNAGTSIFELTRLWKLLYRKYRYQLYANAPARVLSLQDFLLNEELLHYMGTLAQAYQDVRDLSVLFDESLLDETMGQADYNVGRQEMIQKLKEGYVREQTRTKNLLESIRRICDAKGFRDIERNYQQFIPVEELQDFKECAKDASQSVNWKNYLINRVIDRFYQSRMHSFLASVLYLQNYDEAIKNYKLICDTMWDRIQSTFKNMEAVDCLMNGNIDRLITELDETLWFLYFYNGDLNNE